MLKTEAALDTRIEKAIARLAGIKEYERLYGPTSTTVERSEAPRSTWTSKE